MLPINFRTVHQNYIEQRCGADFIHKIFSNEVDEDSDYDETDDGEYEINVINEEINNEILMISLELLLNNEFKPGIVIETVISKMNSHNYDVMREGIEIVHILILLVETDLLENVIDADIFFALNSYIQDDTITHAALQLYNTLFEIYPEWISPCIERYDILDILYQDYLSFPYEEKQLALSTISKIVLHIPKQQISDTGICNDITLISCLFNEIENNKETSQAIDILLEYSNDPWLLLHVDAMLI